jgi:class 3 adenylate cyclase
MGVDVGAWLSGLGLGRYEQAFRDNDIDADLLPTLTSDDLYALGVVSLGHRKRLLSAIALLGKGLRVPRAERRQLTVMFVDLVGSTTLSSRLDPEGVGASRST